MSHLKKLTSNSTSKEIQNQRLFLSRYSLQFRIIFPILTISIVIILTLLWFSFSRMKAASEKQAITTLEELAGRHANQIALNIEESLNLIRSEGQIFEAMRSKGFLPREFVNQAIKSIAEKNSRILGSWSGWEPNALDGKDSNYVNAPGHDQTGRFIPYWNRASGNIALEPLRDYEDPAKGEFYLLPKKNKTPTVLNPYSYSVGGKDILMTSVTYPMYVSGQFVGVMGADIQLTELSETLAQIKPYETGYSALLTGSAIYAAHPEPSQINRQIEELPEGTEIKTAIAQGKKYFIRYSDLARGEVFRIFIPIKFGHTDQTWSLSVAAPVSKILAESRQLLLTQIALSAVALTILAVLLFATTSIVTRFLLQMADQLSAGATSVSSASTELNEISGKLSEGATEQAASIQETASALEEVTQMIRKNSDNASQSQETSQNSKRAAKEGQQAISEMIHAISEMSQSNTQIMNQVDLSNQKISEIVTVISEISQKTKVINDIVFQTKLLSFNASVEAARAGEQGKGFAVVAEEVGNLAAMSGNAAKEISQMLESSIQKVESIISETKTAVASLITEGKAKVEGGSHTARRCGEALEHLLGTVHQVDQMVVEIARSSTEQSRGVEEINKAMGQLDQATQQNTTAAQQSAQSAQHLHLESIQLNQLVDTLRLLIRGSNENVSK